MQFRLQIDLVNRVWALYGSILHEAAQQHVGMFPTSSHLYSASNLKAYLACTRDVNAELLSILYARGLCLSSLEHVLQSLQIVCANLGLIPGAFPISHPQALAKQRREAVMGTKMHGDSPHIMLTLDAAMLGTPVIEQLLLHGMTIARINCAHDDEIVWERLVWAVRKAEERLRSQGKYREQRCKIYMDLAGPKIRVSMIREDNAPIKIKVKKSDRLRVLLYEPADSDPILNDGIPCVTVNLPEALAHVEEGHSVYIDDGKIHGIVKVCTEQSLELEILYPDTSISIKDNKGINLPDMAISEHIPTLTAKDEQDLPTILRLADMVGVSFIRSPLDLQYIKQQLLRNGHLSISVVAKIETSEAVKNLSSILLEGLTFPQFAIMVARGDLAINAGFETLPVIQEEMLSMCRAAHIPVILATQVLDTLAKRGIPSRAELADVSLGSAFDCVMLNKGPFVEEAVKFLQKTLLLISDVKHKSYSITRYANP